MVVMKPNIQTASWAIRLSQDLVTYRKEREILEIKHKIQLFGSQEDSKVLHGVNTYTSVVQIANPIKKVIKQTITELFLRN